MLILSRTVPNPFFPPVARPYYLTKFYAPKISVTLVSPYVIMHETALPEEVNFETSLISTFKNPYLRFLNSVSSRLTLTNLRYARDFYVARTYHPSFQKLIVKVLSKESFDIVYADSYLLSYLFRLKLLGFIKVPTILEFFAPPLYEFHQYLKFGNILNRLTYFFGYLLHRLFVVRRYKHFDGGIYVSNTHLKLSRPFVPRKCFVIPPGVDTEYFKPPDINLTAPVILFTGNMSHPPNVSAVLWFYYNIYSYIKQEIPDVKFYIVGRDPNPRVRKLNSDKSVIVTGRVEDVRPYFAKASVFVNPIILDDGGIKTKVLEAMAMGKPVVSTPLGVRDLGVTDGKNVVIAKNERDFAEKVIELLKDENERQRFGREARKFVEENYSWEKQSKILYETLKFMVEEAKR
ncbi:MAG: glycosyltransferase family 4 protein [Archaeoglobaceae archaeon]